MSESVLIINRVKQSLQTAVRVGIFQKLWHFADGFFLTNGIVMTHWLFFVPKNYTILFFSLSLCPKNRVSSKQV
ncbi:MAG: hypothetical protein Q4D56_13500 [Bacteroides sp.]|nr:hypothetical protein [Bacteroides sp.]